MEILIYIIGGLLAGIATGLVGLSAATIIAPLFATVLGMDPYIAIGIALTSDVFASSTSTITYYKNKHINIKDSIYIIIVVLFFTILASILSSDTSPKVLNSTLNIFVFVLGIRFLVYPVKNRERKKESSPRFIFIQTLIWAAIIGFISGYFGAGGGLSLLAVFTMLLHYDLKKGIGTSVFIMVFIALVGAITHIVIGGTELLPLILTSITAFIGANLSSKYANKIDNVKLNKTIGFLLMIFGAVLIFVYYTQ